jgi:nucleoside-diphosphate-sugar epimerase
VARILVTGASGFIGAAVASALAARGDDVWAFDMVAGAQIQAAQRRHANLRLIPGDVSEWHHVAQALREARPDSVVHCAAVVGVIAAADAPFATLRVNVGGTLNLLEAMRLFDVKRLINLSTEEVYGHFRSDVITEDHPCLPLMPYGISKFAVEQLARDYSRNYGLQCVHLRTCWVFGPGLPRPRPPNNLVEAAVANRPLHLPAGGDFRVDHVYIDDVVAGVLAAIDKHEHRFDAYHIATGAAPSLAEIVAIIRESLPGARLSIGPGQLQFGDRIAVVRKGALDIGRARAELGYAPRFDVRAGLHAYINTFAGRPA